MSKELKNNVLLGKHVEGGSVVSVDLNEIQHLIFKGQIGSGKSILLDNILKQRIENEDDVIMVDLKGDIPFRDYTDKGMIIRTKEEFVTVIQALEELKNKEVEKRTSIFIMDMEDILHSLNEDEASQLTTLMRSSRVANISLFATIYQSYDDLSKFWNLISLASTVEATGREPGYFTYQDKEFLVDYPHERGKLQ